MEIQSNQEFILSRISFNNMNEDTCWEWNKLIPEEHLFPGHIEEVVLFRVDGNKRSLALTPGDYFEVNEDGLICFSISKTTLWIDPGTFITEAW